MLDSGFPVYSLFIPGIFQPGYLKNLGIWGKLQEILVTCFILCFPGFALAGLVSYKTMETSVNNSFQYLTDTDTATATASKPSYQISSKVVTALVSNPATDHLAQPVILTFKHLQVRAESAEMSYTCVFWSEGRVQEAGGAWSRRGCTKVTSNATHTVCSCTHLSSFAVLMALYPVKVHTHTHT
uniref:GAIN-B domain-containing protein n=1 Tax=Hucho hucho TaxID=62062 RepID=A0A4W5LCZ0_9TELE